VTIEQLKKACEARPFQPFVVHLADGRQLAVNSPEFIMTAPTGRTFALYEDDAFQVIDLLLVTGLEIRLGNGGPRKQRRPKAT
jgi:hypothetical protein